MVRYTFKADLVPAMVYRIHLPTKDAIDIKIDSYKTTISTRFYKWDKKEKRLTWPYFRKIKK